MFSRIRKCDAFHINMWSERLTNAYFRRDESPSIIYQPIELAVNSKIYFLLVNSLNSLV